MINRNQRHPRAGFRALLWGGSCLWVLLLLGCSSQPSPHETGHSGLPGHSGLVRYEKNKAIIPRSLTAELEQHFLRLSRYSGVRARFEINGSPVPNAYAWTRNGVHQITLNAGLIDLIGRDADAYAFVIAHELAHVSLGHTSREAGQEQRSRDVTSNILGTLLGAFVPLGALMVDAGNEIVKADYSRDQERAADREGLELMRAAGYDPEGAVRFHQHLTRLSHGGRSGMAIFSSHPSGEERVAAMKALIAEPRSQ